MKRISLTASFVRRAIDDSVWDLGNEVLYDLCRKHPSHRSDDEVLAKVLLIGRVYAASIERRRDNRDIRGDDFYLDVVVPTIRRSDIDGWFQPLRPLKTPTAAAVIPVHARLTQLFTKISGLEKRSLASKYLHFHFPKLVYIYDSRAERAIRQVTASRRRDMPDFDDYDPTYARFFLRCETLRNQLQDLLGQPVCPRELDKVLLAVVQ